MASRKKSPSFEIPDTVRQAGQSGWVYRTGQARPRTTRPSAPLPRPHSDNITAVTDVIVAPVAATTEPPEIANKEPRLTAAPGLDAIGEASPQPELARSERAASSATTARAAGVQSIARWLLGLGVQLALVPIVAPLYLLSSVLGRTFRMSR